MAVVTITKDDEAGLRKTIASVEQQSCSRYEHVVVDGGSRTDIADWLDTWRTRDERRHILVDDPPSGRYPAMNRGILSTTAPVVLILNGGDELRPGALGNVSASFDRCPWRWAYGGIEGRSVDGSTLGEHSPVHYSRNRLRAGLEFVPHPSAYVTRDLYSEIGLYREDLGSGADQELFLRASLVADPHLIPDILGIFEIGGVSSQEGRIGREISWHRMRMVSGTAFGGRRQTDLLMTAALVLRRFLLDARARVQRSVSSADASR